MTSARRRKRHCELLVLTTMSLHVFFEEYPTDMDPRAPFSTDSQHIVLATVATSTSDVRITKSPCGNHQPPEGMMAKSLKVARALWRAGHRVVLVETHKYWCSGSRLSTAVWAFDTVADLRNGANGGEAYLADLRRVFETYGCDSRPSTTPCSFAAWRSRASRSFRASRPWRRSGV